ncbi:hypothetical protein J1N35_018725, partial [Gossypium stocksii]
SWAGWQILFLQPRVTDPYIFSLVMRQRIPSPQLDMKELHKVDMRGRTMKIGCRSTRSTSKLGIVGCNPYWSMNHFSQWTRQQPKIT